jgi:hypothetical protein
MVFAAIVASASYLTLKSQPGFAPDFFDKFWISLPLLAGLAGTGRCIFGRLVGLITRTSRRLSQESKQWN